MTPYHRLLLVVAVSALIGIHYAAHGEGGMASASVSSRRHLRYQALRVVEALALLVVVALAAEHFFR